MAVVAAYAFVLLVGAVVSLIVAGVSWRSRPQPTAMPLVAVMVAAATWMLALVATLSIPDATVSRTLVHVRYVAIPTTVVGWVWLALEFSGRADVLTREVRAALVAFPVIVGTASATSRLHGLFWASIGDPTPTGQQIAETTYATGFWVYTIVAYLVLAAGTVLVLRKLVRTSSLYRSQAIVLIISNLVPWLANVLYFAGDLPVDLTPVGFLVAGVAVGYAQYRFKLMDVSPVGRGSLVDTIREGVFVLDDEDRFVDANTSARRMLGLDAEDRIVGRNAADVFEEYPEVYERYADVAEANEALTLDTPNGTRTFDVRVSPLTDATGRRVGRLFLVHDVTARKRRESELRRQHEQLDEFASLVSDDFRALLASASESLTQARVAEDPAALSAVSADHERLRSVIEDALALARGGRTVEDPGWVSLESVARTAWSGVETGESSLSVDADATVRADRDRLERAFVECFENVREHGGSGARSVRVGMLDGGDSVLAEGGGFFVADDGVGVPAGDREAVLETGYSSGGAGNGLGLSIVSAIAGAHEWSVSVAESRRGGVRVEFRDVTVADRDAAGRDGDGGSDDSTTAVP
jgi:PAS domain S-box-containing protein